MFAELAGALAGSALGGMLGGGGSSKQQLYYTPGFINTMNDMLQKSMNSALNTSERFMNKGVDTLTAARNQNTQTLQDYLKSALSQAQMFGNQGLTGYRTAQSPYATAGYDALDAYKQSLGLSTPMGGSANQVRMQQAAQKLAPLLQSLKGNYSAPVNPGAAPTLNMAAPNREALIKSLDPNAINNFILNKSNFSSYDLPTGGQIVSDGRFQSYDPGTSIRYFDSAKLGIKPSTTNFDILNQSKYMNQVANDPALRAWAQNQLTQGTFDQQNQQYKQAKSAYDTSLNQYNTNLGNYNSYMNTQNSLNNVLNQYSPTQIQQIASQLKGLL